MFSNTHHLPSSAHQIEAISERLIQIGKKYSQHEQYFNISKFYHTIVVVSFCLQDLLGFKCYIVLFSAWLFPLISLVPVQI